MKDRLQKTCVWTIGLAMGAAAWAAEPWVSVPSAPDAYGKVQIQGAELAAYSQVTVRFVNERMAPIDMVTPVAANGRFALKFAPPITGQYLVTVYDANGREIGQGRFGHFR